MKSKKSSSGVRECEERARLREIKVKRQEKNKLYEITKIHVFYSFSRNSNWRNITWCQLWDTSPCTVSRGSSIRTFYGVLSKKSEKQ
jgi:hypothetical protein